MLFDNWITAAQKSLSWCWAQQFFQPLLRSSLKRQRVAQALRQNSVSTGSPSHIRFQGNPGPMGNCHPKSRDYRLPVL